MTMLSHALDLAARGFAVFPCLERGKRPACSRGFRDASTNSATIRRWWSGFHSYNVAVATGSISGIWVVDVDGEQGAATLGVLESKHGALPPTAQVSTGRGMHLWFRLAGAEVQSSAGRIGPGVDVRGNGGYVVAPCSIHPSGYAYQWAVEMPPAVAPAWIIELARRPRISERAMEDIRPPPRTGGAPGAYGQAALDQEIDDLAKWPPGSRNHRLNLASFNLHQLVAGGELDRAEVEHRLVRACEANGLLQEDGLRQCLATIRSGGRAGVQNPRSRPERE